MAHLAKHHEHSKKKTEGDEGEEGHCQHSDESESSSSSDPEEKIVGILDNYYEEYMEQQAKLKLNKPKETDYVTENKESQIAFSKEAMMEQKQNYR